MKLDHLPLQEVDALGGVGAPAEDLVLYLLDVGPCCCDLVRRLVAGVGLRSNVGDQQSAGDEQSCKHDEGIAQRDSQFHPPSHKEFP